MKIATKVFVTVLFAAVATASVLGVPALVSPIFGHGSNAIATTGAQVATNPADLQSYLHEFHKDPKRVMNTRLATFDERGQLIADSVGLGDRLKLTPEEVWQAHGEVRDKMCKAGGRSCDHRNRAAMDDVNTPNRFLWESVYLNKLNEMEDRGLLAGQVPRKPWSDSFWPTAKGQLGRRWLDQGFPDQPTDWLANYTYFLSVAPGASGVNAMSPSEKYDLLVGDRNFTLTNASWADGKYTYDKQGRVPGWTGLCHGWAPASFMTPAPKKSVTVYAVDGTPILFYPSDIKALSTLAWANSPPYTKFAGTKCKTPRPAQDENGRVIDPGCFDVNPATWHIGVVNQMGVNKRSFIFDSQYDYQIWNYPIYSYKYRYFNPQTLESSTSLGGAAVEIGQYSIDKFRKYRNPDTKYVVGIEMDIYFSIETSPSTKAISEPRLESKKWVYDLELAADGSIIGGEWYSNFHPDFMWNAPVDGHTLSDGEDQLTARVDWDGRSPIPDELVRAARVSSAQTQPVSKIVEALVRLSQED